MNAYLDFSSQQVITILLGVVASLFVIVLVGRWMVRRASGFDLAAKYRGSTAKMSVISRTKYPEVEVMQYRPFAMLIGIICALAFTTVLMNWTVIERDVDTSQIVTYTEMEIEITPPQTAEPPPPPPPPPPPTVIEVPENLIDEEEESMEFLDQSIEAETRVDVPEAPVETPKAIPPPPPPPPKDDAEEIFRVVEEMPRFPGCEDLVGSADEKRICAERALLTFIHENLNYPSYARENNIQGNVVVQFVVNKDGTIQDISILRDIGAGCGAEVVRVVRLMNEQHLRWNPGKQRGRPVRVMFVLPVKFSLLVN